MNCRVPKTVFFEVDRKKLEDHIKRVCNRNMRAKCKCCSLCPFREEIRNYIGAMEMTKEEAKR